MDSRDSAVKSGHGGTNVSKSVVRSQMDAISFTPLSRTFAKTLRIRRDCRKFFDKFPRPKSPRRPLAKNLQLLFRRERI